MPLPNNLEQTSKTVVIFDSDCMLCSRFILFLLKYDKKEKLLFTDPKSQYADFLIKTKKLNLPFETVYASYNGKILEKSEAVIHILSQLSWWGKFAQILRIIPVKWRNKVYNWIARNRYRWFGKTQECVLDRVSPKNKRRTIR